MTDVEIRNLAVKYHRLPDESDEELIYRVTGDKDIIGTWQDVADILNELLGTEFTESKFRKQKQAFDKMLKANSRKLLGDNAYMDEIESKLDEIRKERIKLQTLNIERNRVSREVSRRELYYEYIGQFADALPLPHFEPLHIKKDTSKNMEYILCLADMHYGADFVSEHNTYNPEIAEQRLGLLASDIARFVDEHAIERIHIVSLGDTIQGILRVSDISLNSTPAVEAVVKVSRLIAMFLRSLSKFVVVEYYHVPTANHTQTRPLGTKKSELPGEDLEYIIGHYIADLCDGNVRIHTHIVEDEQQYISIPIYNFEVVAMHGHQIKRADQAIKDVAYHRGCFIDYLLLGHLHRGEELPSNEGAYHDMEILINPSFVGSDPYSDSLYKSSKAAVKIYGFHPTYGHTETYKFILN